MNRLDIVVHGIPAPQGSKRHVGNGRMIESSAKVKPWREAVKWAALQEAGVRVVTGSYFLRYEPLYIGITFVLPRPRSHYRAGRNAHLLREGTPALPAGKPDIDKLLRSTLDGLGEAGIWHDDSQVVSVSMQKVYIDPNPGPPGASIRIESLRTSWLTERAL